MTMQDDRQQSKRNLNVRDQGQRAQNQSYQDQSYQNQSYQDQSYQDQSAQNQRAPNPCEPQFNDRLGEEIKNAMASSEKPDDNLNKILMRQVREKEAYLKSAAGTRTISLWFLPMLLNGLLFGMLAFLGYFLIPNMLLAKLVMSACIYMVLAGVALTAAGMWFSDLKEKMVLVLEKGGNKA